METKPIKRDKSIRHFSRDHHHGLLLCWKIRKGLNDNIEIERIARHVRWFWREYLLPHFEEEEKMLLPVLGPGHMLSEKTISQHNSLRELFTGEINEHVLRAIASELEIHIRFEERILFEEIQSVADEKTLLEIEKNHSEIILCNEWGDKFWENPMNDKNHNPV